MLGALLAMAGCGGAPSNDEEFLEQVRNRRVAGEALKPGQGVVPGRNAAADARPIFHIASREIDLGTVTNEASSTHVVTIENRGKLPLEIIDIQTSCACTQGRMVNAEPVPPESEADMEILVIPQRIPGFESTKTLTLTTNDPKNRQVGLEVTVHVEQEFELEPAQVDFGFVPPNTPLKERIVVRQLQEEPLEITGIEARGEEVLLANYTITQIPEDQWTQPGKAEYAIDVSVPAEEVVGPHSEYFFIANSTKRIPYFRVHLKWQVQRQAPREAEPAETISR